MVDLVEDDSEENPSETDEDEDLEVELFSMPGPEVGYVEVMQVSQQSS
jgi:hypothetical protein